MVAECWLISHCHINIFNELLWLYFCNFLKGGRSFPHLSPCWQTTFGHVGGFYDSSFWMQNNLMKVLDLFRLEILIYPISSLADKGTWPQRSTWEAQSASLRTLIEDCWLIQKPWRSCLPSGSLLWWWLSWGSTAQANPTWWTSWLGRTRVSGPSRAQLSPSVHPHPQRAAQWCEESKWETWEGHWKLTFTPQLCSCDHYNLKESAHHSLHFALVSFSKA